MRGFPSLPEAGVGARSRLDRTRPIHLSGQSGQEEDFSLRAHESAPPTQRRRGARSRSRRDWPLSRRHVAALRGGELSLQIGRLGAAHLPAARLLRDDHAAIEHHKEPITLLAPSDDGGSFGPVVDVAVFCELTEPRSVEVGEEADT